MYMHVTYCNTLQHTETHYNTLQYPSLFGDDARIRTHVFGDYALIRGTATHCNTPEITATHCNALQHTSLERRPSSKTLQHTAIYCNTLQRAAIHYNTHLWR